MSRIATPAVCADIDAPCSAVEGSGIVEPEVVYLDHRSSNRNRKRGL
jgi:hypothetical protein